MWPTLSTLNSTNSKAHRAVLFALLVTAIILRLAAFRGYSDSDPRAYTELADQLSRGILHIPAYDGPPVFPLRLGLYAPTALLIRIFGLTEATLAAYPFVISILGCMLTYALARRIVTPLVGLIALGLIAITPIDIAEASLLLPDPVAAFCANAAIAVAFIAIRRSDTRHVVLLGVVSGTLFGVSWLCKETVVYLVPFIVLLAFWPNEKANHSSRMTCLAAIAAASLAVLFAEMVFYTKLTGDPLFRLHATERNYVQTAVWFFNWEPGCYTKALVDRLFYTGPVSLLFNRSMLFMPAFALVSATWAIIFRKRFLAMPIIWLVSLLLMFNFMSSSFNTYKPLVLEPRYTYPVLLPSVILVGGLLATLLNATAEQTLRTERLFPWAVTIALGVCAMSILNGHKLLTSRPEQVERHVAKYLHKEAIVYTDYRSAANLVFFRTRAVLPSNASTMAWENVTEAQIPTGAYVLFNKDKTDFLARKYRYVVPGFALHPPPSWKKVWTYANAKLYKVTGNH